MPRTVSTCPVVSWAGSTRCCSGSCPSASISCAAASRTAPRKSRSRRSPPSARSGHSLRFGAWARPTRSWESPSKRCWRSPLQCSSIPGSRMRDGSSGIESATHADKRTGRVFPISTNASLGNGFLPRLLPGENAALEVVEFLEPEAGHLLARARAAGTAAALHEVRRVLLQLRDLLLELRIVDVDVDCAGNVSLRKLVLRPHVEDGILLLAHESLELFDLEITVHRTCGR